MLESLATLLLLVVMGAFAVCAGLLNEGEHARRRRRRAAPSPPRTGRAPIAPAEAADAADVPSGERRLAVGDFLFGALFLRAPEPLPFAELADTAATSGMSVPQVMGWIERAEARGLIERLTTDAPSDRPAVRLTEAGMDLARNDRRGRPRARSDQTDASGTAHALDS